VPGGPEGRAAPEPQGRCGSMSQSRLLRQCQLLQAATWPGNHSIHSLAGFDHAALGGGLVPHGVLRPQLPFSLAGRTEWLVLSVLPGQLYVVDTSTSMSQQPNRQGVASDDVIA